MGLLWTCVDATTAADGWRALPPAAPAGNAGHSRRDDRAPRTGSYRGRIVAGEAER